MPVPRPNPRLRIRLAYEDRQILVALKMPGTVTEPGIGHRDDSLLNGLFAAEEGRFASALARLGEARDWGLLHRLDRLTSGLVLVALDGDSYDTLRAAFEARRVAKSYLAVVRGELPATGSVDRPLLETRLGDHRVSVLDSRGKPALTTWTTLARAGRYALVRCELVTGRLHQLRVHLAAAGAPIAGDPVYGEGGKPRPQGRTPKRAELCLHAWRLAFPHPVDGRLVTVIGEVPRRFAEFAVEHGLPAPPGHDDDGTGLGPVPSDRTDG